MPTSTVIPLEAVYEIGPPLSTIAARLVRNLTEKERALWDNPKYRVGYSLLAAQLVFERIPKAARPFCGARCRDGHPCRARAVPARTRCRMHGGLSTGPKSEEGRARIAESNRRRAGEHRPPTTDHRPPTTDHR